MKTGPVRIDTIYRCEDTKPPRDIIYFPTLLDALTYYHQKYKWEEPKKWEDFITKSANGETGLLQYYFIHLGGSHFIRAYIIPLIRFE